MWGYILHGCFPDDIFDQRPTGLQDDYWNAVILERFLSFPIVVLTKARANAVLRWERRSNSDKFVKYYDISVEARHNHNSALNQTLI